jgi:hypothetical protein
MEKQAKTFLLYYKGRIVVLAAMILAGMNAV